MICCTQKTTLRCEQTDYFITSLNGRLMLVVEINTALPNKRISVRRFTLYAIHLIYDVLLTSLKLKKRNMANDRVKSTIVT